MGRDRGKGKRGGRGGGGKKMFIANVEELQLRDNQVNEIQKSRANRRGDNEESDDNDEDETKETGESTETKANDNEIVFEDERPRGLLISTETANPNAVVKQQKMIKVKNMKDLEEINPEEGLSRREREALEAERRKEEYQRKHMAGETEAAKRELAMLAIVRKRREEAKAKREAEGRKPGMSATGLPDDDDNDDDDSDDEEDDEEEDEDAQKNKAKSTSKPAPTASATLLANKKREAAAAAPVASGPVKLKAIDIKKMNGDALKDHLRERGLDLQGQKKDLMKRLLDFEAARENA